MSCCRGAPGEAGRDENRLVPGRDPDPLELVDDGRDRELARIGGDAGDRQRRRLDDDRRSTRPAGERGERLAVEREVERVAHGSGDVACRRSGGGGGRSTTASSGAVAITSRVPERRGIRGTADSSSLPLARCGFLPMSRHGGAP